MAKHVYSDKAMIRFTHASPKDLPRTRTSRSLETSILLARGIDEFFAASGEQEALSNIEAAAKLTLTNGLIAYYTGLALIYSNRSAEATPYFQRAVQFGNAGIARQAKSYIK